MIDRVKKRYEYIHRSEEIQRSHVLTQPQDLLSFPVRPFPGPVKHRRRIVDTGHIVAPVRKSTCHGTRSTAQVAKKRGSIRPIAFELPVFPDDPVDEIRPRHGVEIPLEHIVIIC